MKRMWQDKNNHNAILSAKMVSGQQISVAVMIIWHNKIGFSHSGFTVHIQRHKLEIVPQ
jgi:hypothetical protein